MIGNGTVIFLN